jgi:hypothetical protein
VALCNISGRFYRSLSIFFGYFLAIEAGGKRSQMYVIPLRELKIFGYFITYEGLHIAKTLNCCHIIPGFRRIMLA